MLAITVIIGLFLYLKFFFFMAVVLLIAGANMPEQIAEGLNMSKMPIMLALIALVGVVWINHLVKLMPTGLEPRPREKSREGVQALFYAIEKRNLVYAQKVLSMNFDPNLHHDNGYTPLAYAAMKGSQPMVELLLEERRRPACRRRRKATRRSELALRFSHGEVADSCSKRARAREPGAPRRRSPAAEAAQTQRKPRALAAETLAAYWRSL